MIGTLTNDMTRLWGEIGTLRESRGVLRGNLAQSRKDLKDTVSQMQTDFRNAHAEMASQTRTNRRDFVSNVEDAVTALKQGVGAFRAEILGDVAGAHRAWWGKRSSPTSYRTTAAEQPKDTAAKAKKKKH